MTSKKRAKYNLRNLNRLEDMGVLKGIEASDLKNDRVAVMIIGADIDNDLRDVIETAFINKADDLLEDIFYSPNAPLSTFSSKINIAYALGIIDERTKYNLDRLRSIRNAFAHYARSITFEHDLVKKEARKISLSDQTIRKMYEKPDEFVITEDFKAKFSVRDIIIMAWSDTVRQFGIYYQHKKDHAELMLDALKLQREFLEEKTKQINEERAKKREIDR